MWFLCWNVECNLHDKPDSTKLETLTNWNEHLHNLCYPSKEFRHLQIEFGHKPAKHKIFESGPGETRCLRPPSTPANENTLISERKQIWKEGKVGISNRKPLQLFVYSQENLKIKRQHLQKGLCLYAQGNLFIKTYPQWNTDQIPEDNVSVIGVVLI